MSEYFREPAMVTFRHKEGSCFQVYAVPRDNARTTEHNGSVPFAPWAGHFDELASGSRPA